MNKCQYLEWRQERKRKSQLNVAVVVVVVGLSFVLAFAGQGTPLVYSMLVGPPLAVALVSKSGSAKRREAAEFVRRAIDSYRD